MAGFRARRFWYRKPSWLLVWVMFEVWAGPNRVEETRLVEDLTETPHLGQVVQIAGYTALHTRAQTQTARGAVVFLPEAGQRSDSLLAARLNEYFPAHGWEFLSLQLPVLEPEAGPEEYLTLLEEAATRLKAAIAWLKTGGSETVAAVGHGFGGLALLQYLSQPELQLKAIVLLSVAWPEALDGQVQPWLEAAQLPVLDVYAEQDPLQVRSRALERRLLLKGKPSYRQIQFSAADHQFKSREDLLARRIDGWLRQVVTGGGS